MNSHFQSTTSETTTISNSAATQPVTGSNLRRVSWCQAAALAAGMLFLGGCNLPQPQADTVRYFTLSQPVTTSMTGATVRPVQLAGHLRGRAMAVRVAENEVIYDEDARWAESLDDAITQILRARVGGTGAGSVITVHIQRCELVRSENNSVQLAATYTIAGPGGEADVKRGNFKAGPRTWDGKDYGSLVTQIHDAIAELGDAIAADLK